MTLRLTFRRDDLTGGAIRSLIAHHLAGMHAHSPACSVHALDVDRLRQPEIEFWSAWSGAELVGCGALKRIDALRGELKSMRVADAFLGRGAGKSILAHLTAEARSRGHTSLWLETGSSPAFAPAIAMYEAAGFARCGPFEGYEEDPFSVYMTRAL
ncbi:MAG: GNAT family N-acetyltransferase [Polyangiales bacterium]